MNEESSTLATPLSAPIVAPKAPPRSGLRPLVWLLALAAVIAGVYAIWRMQATELGRSQSLLSAEVETQRLRDQGAAFARTLDQMRHDDETLRARLDDADKVNKSLREELLGLTERARLLEDAVANLADKRLSGRDAMLLDETEILLLLAGQRYTLFQDPAAAIAAYQRADAALTEVNDAAFSTVRQSIGAEVEAFAALKAVDIPGDLARLAQLRERLATLPPATRADIAAAAPSQSRLWQTLSQLVRVRHDEDAQTMLALRDRSLARELVALDLRDAQAALLGRDQSAYRNALATARAQLSAGFDGAADPVRDALSLLDRLAAVPLAPPPPQILGSALKELRNLRATHALRAVPKATTTPARGDSS